MVYTVVMKQFKTAEDAYNLGYLQGREEGYGDCEFDNRCKRGILVPTWWINLLVTGSIIGGINGLIVISLIV